jgi:hypothetical protein
LPHPWKNPLTSTTLLSHSLCWAFFERMLIVGAGVAEMLLAFDVPVVDS